jgi:hypothetical protein
MGEEPEEQRKCGAEDKAGDDRKVEGGVFAAVDDIAGETAEAEWKPAAEVKKGAYDNEEAAEEEESAAEFAKRVRKKDCRRNEVEK